MNVTLDDTQKPKSQPDYLQNYGLWIIQFGLMLMQLNDTEKEGDGERLIRNSKALLLLFRMGKRGKKYAYELFRLISNVKCQMTEQMAERTINGRFVNWKGTKAGNCANDLKQEHLVKFTKMLIRGMGAQKTTKAMSRATTAASGLTEIVEQFDDTTNIHPESTAHSHKLAESDIQNMIDTINHLHVFETKPGRAHPSFRSLPRSVYENVDITKLVKWMRSTKKKLASDPGATWEPDSDDENDEEDEGDIHSDSDDEHQD